MTHDSPSLGGDVALFEAPDGQIRLDVRLERDTVWLSLNQMAELFGRDKSVISRHLRNIFTSGELDRAAVVAKTATTAADGKTYQVEYFDLDAVLSVGYRVNSKRGTQFRIWATRTLRDYLVQGYTLNERRLREKGLTEMEQAVRLLARTLSAHELVNEQGWAVLDVVTHYARSWRLLLQYDENRLPELPAQPTHPVASLSPDDSRRAIAGLKQALMAKGEATALFGQERGGALDGILGSIEQTFGGEALYASVESRAAHLLTLLHHQGSSLRRRQQTHRQFPVSALSRSQRHVDQVRRPTALRRQRLGCGGITGRRKRSRAERATDPVDLEFSPGWWRMTACILLATTERGSSLFRRWAPGEGWWVCNSWLVKHFVI